MLSGNGLADRCGTKTTSARTWLLEPRPTLRTAVSGRRPPDLRKPTRRARTREARQRAASHAGSDNPLARRSQGVSGTDFCSRRAKAPTAMGRASRDSGHPCQ